MKYVEQLVCMSKQGKFQQKGIKVTIIYYMSQKTYEIKKDKATECTNKLMKKRIRPWLKVRTRTV